MLVTKGSMTALQNQVLKLQLCADRQEGDAGKQNDKLLEKCYELPRVPSLMGKVFFVTLLTNFEFLSG